VGSSVESEFTVAIIDDQPVTRAGTEQVVSDDPRLKVVASVASVDRLRRDQHYDALFLAVPGDGGVAALALVSRVHVAGPTVVTSTWACPPAPLAVIQAGARGCVTRYSERDAIAAALRIVATGGLYLCPRLVEPFLADVARPDHDESGALAPREIETLRWIAGGFTQSQIATRMGLSQATINTYAKRIRRKLNAGNKAELTRLAIELGYVGHGRRNDPAA